MPIQVVKPSVSFAAVLQGTALTISVEIPSFPTLDSPVVEFGSRGLPGAGTAIAGLGAVFVLFPNVNAFIQGPFWLLSKIFVFLFVYVWMRGTLPRFRYDQLMAFGWKLLLPVSIVNVALTSFVILAKMQWGAK